MLDAAVACWLLLLKITCGGTWYQYICRDVLLCVCGSCIVVVVALLLLVAAVGWLLGAAASILVIGAAASCSSFISTIVVATVALLFSEFKAY